MADAMTTAITQAYAFQEVLALKERRQGQSHVLVGDMVYPTLTRQQALDVDKVHANGKFDSKGNCCVWRRNGATQTWKSAKNALRFRLPLKYGLYRYDAVTERDTHLVHSPEDCPFAQ